MCNHFKACLFKDTEFFMGDGLHLMHVAMHGVGVGVFLCLLSESSKSGSNCISSTEKEQKLMCTKVHNRAPVCWSDFQLFGSLV